MTSRPSKLQTGFCSPSSTRNFGATPFARNSFSWSEMYCVGFCFVAIVAVSDMRRLLRWTRLVELLFCVSLAVLGKQFGSKLLRQGGKVLRLARHSIRIQQDLPRQPALQFGK